MFKQTRNDFRMIKDSGISTLGAIIMTAFLFVTMPFVNLWFWYKTKTDKSFQIPDTYGPLKTINKKD